MQPILSTQAHKVVVVALVGLGVIATRANLLLSQFQEPQEPEAKSALNETHQHQIQYKQITILQRYQFVFFRLPDLQPGNSL